MAVSSPRIPLPGLLPALLAVSCLDTSPARHYLAEEAERDRALEFPPARVGNQVDEYHGYHVEDPYRWLEDTEDPETRVWLDAQRVLADAWLADLPGRRDLRLRLEQLWGQARRELPVVEGGRLFFLERDGLADQPVLLVADSPTRRPRVLVDPNELSRDGRLSLAEIAPSEDGRLLAYAISDRGSDWRVWRLIEVDSGRHRDDVVTGNKLGGLAWARDGSGFFYPHYGRRDDGPGSGAPDASPEIRFHALGTAEEDDRVVVPRPQRPGTLQGFHLTDDGQALVVSRRDARTRRDELDLVPLEGLEPPEVLAGGAARSQEAAARPEAIPLARGYDAQYRFLGGDARRVWILTDLDAPRWRVIAVDLERPSRDAWRVVVPEAEDTIREADLVGGRLVVTYVVDAASRVEVFDPSGTHVHTVDLPGIGTARGFRGDPDDDGTFFSFSSFTCPPTLYRYDLERARRQVWFQPEPGFRPADFETRHVVFRSADGTRVPMFLTHEKGLELDGRNPTYLYGGGDFDAPFTPTFRIEDVVWLERGGLLAVPSLRGGGEFGEAWYEAGTKRSKQNALDDFVAAAEYLIDNRYTSPSHLAIGGAANGGLLVGACLTQRPELFAAAVPEVGVLDMLRYHRFTLGWTWAGDYGTVDDPGEFRALLEYSPYHNVHPGTEYPATLIMTADHDDRVVPAHSYKFAAALQAAQVGEDPVLLRVEAGAGHGSGIPTSRAIAAATDRLAFLLNELGEE